LELRFSVNGLHHTGIDGSIHCLEVSNASVVNLYFNPKMQNLCSVGIITSVPPTSVGVASGIFSAAQQVGGAIHIAVITTIFVQIRDSSPFPSYASAAAAFWYLVALGLVEMVLVIVFFSRKNQ
jgi:hypothetical protein